FSFFLGLRLRPRSTLFPYTTLFRSQALAVLHQHAVFFCIVPLLHAQFAQEVLQSLAFGGLLGGAHRMGQRGVQSRALRPPNARRSEEHTSELQSLAYLVCRLLLEKK